MLKRLLVIVFIFAALLAKGQVNLVPNGSFEVIDSCPEYDGKIHYAQPWFSPNYGTTDLFDSCSSSNLCGMPVNTFGYQQPKSGYRYAGIGLIGKYLDSFDYREYLAVKLTRNLEKNKYYCFTMYCSLFDIYYDNHMQNLNDGIPPYLSVYTMNKIGIYFSPDSIYQNSVYALDYTPQIINSDANPIASTIAWTKVEGIYHSSNGNETYIYIGNFYSNTGFSLDTLLTGSNMEPAVYFYIDDVSLVECDGVGIQENAKQAIQIYPNPATTNLTISNTNLQNAFISLYDISGRQLLQQKLNNTTQIIDVSALSPGVYVAAVYADGKIVKREKVIINR